MAPIRNPFSEYECGQWYARALASYGLLQGLTGDRYDAIEKTLHIDSKVGDDFRSFLATASGFGTVGLGSGRPFVEMKMGDHEIQRVYVSGQARELLGANRKPNLASGFENPDLETHPF